MSLTRVDCHYQTDESPNRSSSAFVVLNPVSRPGTVVAAGSAAQRENIGSQVACKLAIEHFVDGVLDHFSHDQTPHPEDTAAAAGEDHEISVTVLEAAFKRANSSVYSFGHKLAAGGRMSASLIGMVISKGSVAAARAGDGAAFLVRQGEMFPFFETKLQTLTADQAHEQLVGAHSLVSVELASVPIEPDDVVLLLSRSPTEAQERRLPVVVRTLEADDPNPVDTLIRRVFDGEVPHFALLVKMGPDAIYLDRPV